MRIDIPAQHQDNPVAFVAGDEIVRIGMAYASSAYQHSPLSLREFEAARAMPGRGGGRGAKTD